MQIGEEAFQHFSYLYIKYVQIFKNLEDCYDQIVHPQKRQSAPLGMMSCPLGGSMNPNRHFPLVSAGCARTFGLFGLYMRPAADHAVIIRRFSDALGRDVRKVLEATMGRMLEIRELLLQAEAGKPVRSARCGVGCAPSSSEGRRS